MYHSGTRPTHAICRRRIAKQPPRIGVEDHRGGLNGSVMVRSVDVADPAASVGDAVDVPGVEPLRRLWVAVVAWLRRPGLDLGGFMPIVRRAGPVSAPMDGCLCVGPTSPSNYVGGCDTDGKAAAFLTYRRKRRTSSNPMASATHRIHPRDSLLSCVPAVAWDCCRTWLRLGFSGGGD